MFPAASWAVFYFLVVELECTSESDSNVSRNSSLCLSSWLRATLVLNFLMRSDGCGLFFGMRNEIWVDARKFGSLFAAVVSGWGACWWSFSLYLWSTCCIRVSRFQLLLRVFGDFLWVKFCSSCYLMFRWRLSKFARFREYVVLFMPSNLFRLLLSGAAYFIFGSKLEDTVFIL